MALGKIAAFELTMGCGLIAPDEGGPSVFVHADDLGGQQNVGVGTPVRFSSVQGIRGPRAYNVRILTAPSDDPCDDGSLTGDVGYGGGYLLEVQILSRRQYAEEITNILISAIPGATSAQIVEAQSALAQRAARRGWLADQIRT
jgi:CspA family cold shock protein